MRYLILLISILFNIGCSPSNHFKLSNIPKDGKSIKENVWVITDKGAPSKTDFKRLALALKSNNKDILIMFPNIEEFPANALSHAGAVTSDYSIEIVAPIAIKIEAEAFANMINLSSVSMPNVEVIGRRAFSSCYFLRSVFLPKVSDIPEYGFSQCRSLTNIDVSNVESVGAYGFMDCNSLVTLSLPSVIALHNNSLSCDKLKQIDLPQARFIGRKAFLCQSIEELYLPSVVTVEESGISECKSLLKLELPRVQTIGRTAFFGNYKLKELTIATESKIERVGESLFSSNSKVKENVHLILGKENKDVVVNGRASHAANYWAGIRFKSITLK